jgi:hypothetical protein
MTACAGPRGGSEDKEGRATHPGLPSHPPTRPATHRPTHPRPLPADPEDQILEVAVSTGGLDGAPPRAFERLVAPLTPALNEAAKLAHRITEEELAGAPLWPEAAAALVAWVAQECARTHPRGCTPVFIGHNIRRWAAPARAAIPTLSPKRPGRDARPLRADRGRR